MYMYSLKIFQTVIVKTHTEIRKEIWSPNFIRFNYMHKIKYDTYVGKNYEAPAVPGIKLHT